MTKAMLDMNTDVLDDVFHPEIKTFKQQTEEYIDSINQFLEEQEDLDINTETVLEDIIDKLQQIVGYL